MHVLNLRHPGAVFPERNPVKPRKSLQNSRSERKGMGFYDPIRLSFTNCSVASSRCRPFRPRGS